MKMAKASEKDIDAAGDAMSVLHDIGSVTLVGSPAEIGLAHIDIDEMQRFAVLVRAAALEEVAGVTGEFAQKWWSMHCASNKHMETTRKAHDDFCALQAAIRALKERLK